jgi:hypothetical protein
MEKQIFPALSDEEVYEMFIDEWERKFNFIEEEIILIQKTKTNESKNSDANF